MSILSEDLKIIRLIHPDWLRNSNNWKKYRLVYEGGQNFIRSFLRKYSKREDEKDFRMRKSLTYSAAFAKAELNNVKNAIVQRFPDISREGGPQSYIEAVAGRNNGVNLTGMSMNTFLATQILPELLSMGRVGIFIDSPSDIAVTLADRDPSIDRPYLYRYFTEQIRSWSWDSRRPDRLLAVLLEDVNFIQDEKTNLTIGTNITYRHMWIEQGVGVWVQFYDQKGEVEIEEPLLLELDEIPFVMLQLSDSLLLDIADYQVALLNMESSDIDYILKANFAFYTEQYDARSDSPYLKKSGVDQNIVNVDYSTQKVTEDSVEEVAISAGGGRRYPIGTERPAFINPSSEPLTISIQKQENIKRDIRTLINMTLANLQPSGNEKSQTANPIEAGLVVIGAVLETAERRTGQIWSKYEKDKNYPSVTYPETYNLRTEQDRQEEADKLIEKIPKIPSKTYQKEVSKQVADITIGHKVSSEVLNKIKSEIDASEVVISDPDIIKTDLENGLVGVELASKIRGYPKGEVEKAKKDHADRIERINAAQTLGTGKENQTGVNDPQARGTSDLGANNKAGKEEKTASRDTTLDSTPTDHTRGEGQ